eukprot:6577270-Pyramimonas_sp.AAC.1
MRAAARAMTATRKMGTERRCCRTSAQEHLKQEGRGGKGRGQRDEHSRCCTRTGQRDEPEEHPRSADRKGARLQPFGPPPPRRDAAGRAVA